MRQYKQELAALDQPSWVSDVPFYDQTIGSLGSGVVPAVQLQNSSRSRSPSPSPGPGPTSGGKKHLASIALAYDKVLAEEAEQRNVAEMPSDELDGSCSGDLEARRARRRGPKPIGQDGLKFSKRTHQTMQKPLARLPRAVDVMKILNNSIAQGVSVLQTKSEHHKTNVLLKKT